MNKSSSATAHYPFRKFHTLEILHEYDPHRGPFDIFLSNYFRANKALGSKDRADIASSCYFLLRWRGLLDALLKGKAPTWDARYAVLGDRDPHSFKGDPTLQPFEKASMPAILFEKLQKAYGEEKALSIAYALSEEAPTTIRANPEKTSREELAQTLLLHGIETTKTQHAPHGLILSKRAQLFQLEEFKQGLFEMQDEGSQLLAELVDAKPKDEILDYCAGSGGKSLAFAYKLQKKGQLFLHDIRKEALAEAKQRLKRSGIQCAQCLQSDDSKKKMMLRNRMNWVIVDAPCSGTGALRRNPDMKWRMDDAFFARYIALQRQVVKEAIPYLRPNGKLLYATCSILPEENEEQVEFFCREYGVKVAGPFFRSLPELGEVKSGHKSENMDGFFGAILSL